MFWVMARFLSLAVGGLRGRACAGVAARAGGGRRGADWTGDGRRLGHALGGRWDPWPSWW